MSGAASTLLQTDCELLNSSGCWPTEAASRLLLLVLLVIVLFACGCDRGPRLGQVEGVVRLDGEALPDATVIFQPQPSGPQSYGETDAAGRYELMFSDDRPGAVVGSHRVTVETYRIRVNEAGEVEEDPERLPARYHAESQLARDVAAGKQTINLDLRSE